MKFSNIRILPGFFLFAALGILIVPLKWLVAWIVAAALHELFHIQCLRLFGYHIYSVEIGLTGARITTDAHSGIKVSLCALAGPLGGFLLLPLLRVMPRLALCGTFQALYNLIPVYPLDGGRAIKGIVEHFFTETVARRILLLIENTILVLLSAAALYTVVKLQMGLYPIVLAGVLIVRNKKIPCKERLLRVQ